MRTDRLVAILLLLSAPAALRADRVDDLVREHLEKRKTPAVSVAVIHKGEVVKSQGYGLANVELNVPASTKTVYQLGSITKQFTAVAILMLAEAGKLNVDEAINQILPDLPKAWSGITVRQLLTHTSGIVSYTSMPEFREMERKDVKHADVVKFVADKPLKFKPGERWDYSNTGYYLLGMIVEKLSGKSYGDYLQEKVFGPLGMTSTRANDLSAVIPNRAVGYTRRGNDVRNAQTISMTWPYSAGVLVSTVEDMAKWDAALGTEKLLKKSSWEMAWAPVKLNDGTTHPYGYGWGMERANGHPVIAHGGGIPGFSTDMARYPADELTVIVLANSDAANPGALRTAIAQHYVPALAPATAAAPDNDPALTKRAREVVEQAAAGTLKPEMFTPDMAKLIFPDRVKEGKQFLGSLGTIEKVTLVKRSDSDGLKSSEYLVKFKSETLRVSLSVDREGKIAGLAFRPE